MLKKFLLSSALLFSAQGLYASAYELGEPTADSKAYDVPSVTHFAGSSAKSSRKGKVLCVGDCATYSHYPNSSHVVHHETVPLSRKGSSDHSAWKRLQASCDKRRGNPENKMSQLLPTATAFDKNKISEVRLRQEQACNKREE